MSRNVERRVCGLCGMWFLLIFPPGEEPTDRDKLCGECLKLPPPPDES
jgi:hypothetical protein